MVGSDLFLDFIDRLDWKHDQDGSSRDCNGVITRCQPFDGYHLETGEPLDCLGKRFETVLELGPFANLDRYSFDSK